MKVMTLAQEKIFRFLLVTTENSDSPTVTEEARKLVIDATSQQIANATYAIDNSLLPATVKMCLEK